MHGYNEFFPSPLDTRLEADGRTWTLLEDFHYNDPIHGWIIVPKGTRTDLASIPRLLWALLPPFGKYAFGAVVHDFVYGQRMYGVDVRGWRRSDRILWRAMKLAPHRVSAAVRVTIYLGLLCGGWVAYFRFCQRVPKSAES